MITVQLTFRANISLMKQVRNSGRHDFKKKTAMNPGYVLLYWEKYVDN